MSDRVQPYLLREHVVVVLARTLAHPVKEALILSGPELPMKIVLGEPEDDRCTHRIHVEFDDDDSVRVVLRMADSDDVQRRRTIRWNDNPARKEELIAAIRELAGLDAT